MTQKKIFSYLLMSQLVRFLFFYFSVIVVANAANNFDNGKQLFLKNCAVCHIDGNNIIIPEKNLKKEALEENGMNTLTAITYQILNGKNGMPAFEERLDENQIEAIAKYVLEKSNQNFLEH
jgi:cytochrome c6